MKIVTRIVILLIPAFFAVGCKKYEENPTVNLLTVKRRLTRCSFITEYSVNNSSGLSVTGSPGNDYIHFYRNGNFYGEHALLFQFNGKWEFEDHKNELRIFSDTRSYTFKILRLDTHYLHIKNDSIEWSCKRFVEFLLT